jgi:hypothetical protein
VSQPIQTPIRLTFQEVLRSIGAWADVRGYQDVRIAGSVDGITIEGVLSLDGAGGKPERLALDNDQLLRFCEASRLNRSPSPTVSPRSRPQLTIVPFITPDDESSN